ncbi:GNAT family N-acetyltransferase [Hansschlegelia quercus]|nr:GNAT family N-acetyltransferase [Hansschlegelia quercus]
MAWSGDFASPALTTASSPASGRAFASIELYRSVDSAWREWAALAPDAMGSAYQTPGFVGAWMANAAAPDGLAPLIVAARDAHGRMVALLPLSLRSRFGVTTASFAGGSHSNYNMPLIRSDALDGFTAEECARLLEEAGAAAGVDLFALENQPETWQGAANPFALLSGQPSPAPAFCGPLSPDVEEYFSRLFSTKTRSKQRRKMRRFEEIGAARIYRAETRQERQKLLDAFLAQKGRQFAERGIADVFARPGVRDFLAEAAGLNGAAPAMDIYGFDLDGETIAVTGGFGANGRYSNMIISITSGEHSKYSPGEMLLNFLVEDLILRGFHTFDLGVGVAGYKLSYCPNEETLRDVFFPVTAKGRAAGAAAAALRAAKSWAKNDERVYAVIEKLRALKSRSARPASDGSAD